MSVNRLQVANKETNGSYRGAAWVCKKEHEGKEADESNGEDREEG